MLALDEKKATLAELEQFSPLKVELDKLGISIEDIPRTINIIRGVQKSGYDVNTIKQVLSAWEVCRVIHAQLEKKIELINRGIFKKNVTAWRIRHQFIGKKNRF